MGNGGLAGKKNGYACPCVAFLVEDKDQRGQVGPLRKASGGSPGQELTT